MSVLRLITKVLALVSYMRAVLGNVNLLPSDLSGQPCKNVKVLVVTAGHPPFITVIVALKVTDLVCRIWWHPHAHKQEHS